MNQNRGVYGFVIWMLHFVLPLVFVAYVGGRVALDVAWHGEYGGATELVLHVSVIGVGLGALSIALASFHSTQAKKAYARSADGFFRGAVCAVLAGLAVYAAESENLSRFWLVGAKWVIWWAVAGCLINFLFAVGVLLHIFLLAKVPYMDKPEENSDSNTEALSPPRH